MRILAYHTAPLQISKTSKLRERFTRFANPIIDAAESSLAAKGGQKKAMTWSKEGNHMETLGDTDFDLASRPK